MNWLLHILGADNGSGSFYLFGSGSGGLLIEVVVIGGISWLAKRLIDRLHRSRMAQADRHHQEKLAQDREHHKVHLEVIRRHHQQLLDQAEAHHGALKAHLTAAAAPSPPKPPVRKPAGVS